MKKETVVLLHGIARTKRGMSTLEKAMNEVLDILPLLKTEHFYFALTIASPRQPFKACK